MIRSSISKANKQLSTTTLIEESETETHESKPIDKSSV